MNAANVAASIDLIRLYSEHVDFADLPRAAQLREGARLHLGFGSSSYSLDRVEALLAADASIDAVLAVHQVCGKTGWDWCAA